MTAAVGGTFVGVLEIIGGHADSMERRDIAEEG
jgi:hypothetical protein